MRGRRFSHEAVLRVRRQQRDTAAESLHGSCVTAYSFDWTGGSVECGQVQLRSSTRLGLSASGL
jgi:hypothetical protein